VAQLAYIAEIKNQLTEEEPIFTDLYSTW